MIRLIVMDVDGTLTDGRLLYDQEGGESKAFHVADGLGIALARGIGIEIAVLSGRSSKAVERRMSELDVRHVLLGVSDKKAALGALLHKLSMRPSEAAYIGDDLNDLPAFEAVGLTIAVGDGSDYLKCRADFTTSRHGGQGAVREAIEEILRRQRDLDRAIAAYAHRLISHDGASQ